MILPDANLFLYAYDSTSPLHLACRDWWSQGLSGRETVVLCPVVLVAFVRIGTSTRAFDQPLTIMEAANHIEEWLKTARKSTGGERIFSKL